MNVEAYLKRMDTSRPAKPDLAALKELQLRHMLHVPFENLDVIRQTPITLNIASFYEKVVGRRRGGFCYELNGLFSTLLKELGFTVRLIAATVAKPDGTWGMPESHATILAELDRSYLVDVGFGDSARSPVPLDGTPVEDASGVYRAAKVPEADGLYDLQRAGEDGAWSALYRFSTAPRSLGSFAEACTFNQTSPESHFTQKLLATKATATGRVTISGDQLIETDGDVKSRQPLAPEELEKTLISRLGLSV
ncbi:arylamine N-acetyltransferase family protein [Paenibacillus chitinolyticus]|uniref:arylamine N-acetyltransferase family protein n=1 Tax=Paenibacillus chitinolyticus TaxID=79263 RepID=UPI001C471C4E|nr:arylamine N-acetyltransferase [Paenibacillus chitinolyticus]MBV6715174.1 arylamine N-acetyltransferase [Paenibacillus chitinolyticus]